MGLRLDQITEDQSASPDISTEDTSLQQIVKSEDKSVRSYEGAGDSSSSNTTVNQARSDSSIDDVSDSGRGDYFNI